jgi:cobyrinic acid a,c-diamide synthase
LAKAFVLAAPKSGSGKTLVTLGLIRAFRNKGLKVASAKVGPDYIDGRFHEAASGLPCINLDPWAMGIATCRARLADIAIGVDLVIVEGVMGLFDGPEGQTGSTADLAEGLGLPIVMVADTTGQAQSLAASLFGFRSFRPTLNFAGTILNKVASDRHQRMLLENWNAAGLPLLGLLRQSDSHIWPSRHLGLVQAQEIQKLEEFIEAAALGVARETSLDKLFESAGVLTNQPVQPVRLPPVGQRIAVAQDVAFAFAYPHLLADWRAQGAEIRPFSPLANQAPDTVADAVFLPGGYPELHAGELAAASAFLNGLRNHPGLIYGECGGYMVLGNALIDSKGKSHAMAGLLPLTTSFATRKLHLGYRQLKPLAGPWKQNLRGHEFHYSTIAEQDSGEALFQVKDATGADLGSQGQRIGKVMGSYNHVISVAP